MSKTNIYVIRLEGGRYYVGKTDNLEKRQQQHVNGTASTWTKKYKPVAVEKIIKNASPFDEDKYTKEYMSKYGIDKVRGGTYSQMELSANQREMIQTELKGATDACQHCGVIGHFIRYCPNKNKAASSSIKTSHNTSKSGQSSSKYANKVEDCEWECEYCDRTFTTEFGCGIHEKSCKEKHTKTSQAKQAPAKKEEACYRCGRPGHYSTDCYARTHKKGYTLDSDCESDDDSDCETDYYSD